MAHHRAPAPPDLLRFCVHRAKNEFWAFASNGWVTILVLVPVVHGIHRDWHLFRASMNRKSRLAPWPPPPLVRACVAPAASGRSRSRSASASPG